MPARRGRKCSSPTGNITRGSTSRRNDPSAGGEPAERRKRPRTGGRRVARRHVLKMFDAPLSTVQADKLPIDGGALILGENRVAAALAGRLEAAGLVGVPPAGRRRSRPADRASGRAVAQRARAAPVSSDRPRRRCGGVARCRRVAAAAGTGRDRAVPARPALVATARCAAARPAGHVDRRHGDGRRFRPLAATCRRPKAACFAGC